MTLPPYIDLGQCRGVMLIERYVRELHEIIDLHCVRIVKVDQRNETLSVMSNQLILRNDTMDNLFAILTKQRAIRFVVEIVSILGRTQGREKPTKGLSVAGLVPVNNVVLDNLHLGRIMSSHTH